MIHHFVRNWSIDDKIDSIKNHKSSRKDYYKINIKPQEVEDDIPLD